MIYTSFPREPHAPVHAWAAASYNTVASQGGPHAAVYGGVTLAAATRGQVTVGDASPLEKSRGEGQT